jgi:hypothetical protein
MNRRFKRCQALRSFTTNDTQRGAAPAGSGPASFVPQHIIG